MQTHHFNPPLFRTVPKKDFFHFGLESEEPAWEKVVGLLKYKKEDVSAAANVPTASVRYDKKMPIELKERLTEWAVALNLVAEFFKDEEKTILWFCMPNPLLGGIPPRDMIRIGRFKKLLKFIQNALDENVR